jgi:SAM-dependent methyltransferase
MREETATLLRCPRCLAEGALRLDARERDEREVRSETLTCSACGRSGEITRGVADLLERPPAHVVREAAGLGRFAEFMLSDGWDAARVLNLPDEPDGYWAAQRLSFEAFLERVDFRAGQRLLDIGANTCWASAAFAARGLDVIALDISLHELQGLYTADFWIAERDVFFERLLAPMFDLPLVSGSLDHVFCCEVLHHNDRRSLGRTFAEIHRVLKRGGVLSVVNETMRFPLNPKLHPGHEVADFDGYEHAFLFSSYWRAARGAGFDVEVVEPASHWVFKDEPLILDAATKLTTSVKLAGVNFCRRQRPLRRAYLHWLNLFRGGVHLCLICRKP